jgi:hypothetical protein
MQGFSELKEVKFEAQAHKVSRGTAVRNGMKGHRYDEEGISEYDYLVCHFW